MVSVPEREPWHINCLRRGTAPNCDYDGSDSSLWTGSIFLCKRGRKQEYARKKMSEQFDLVLSGGNVVLGNGIFRHDLAVRKGVVAAVAPDIPSGRAREVLDVRGKLLFPGIIDVHSHPLYEDDYEATSVTAAWGGITTMIHYAYAFPGESIPETIQKAVEQASRVSYVDFALHVGLFQVENQYKQIPKAFPLGVRTFKMFMTYAKLGRLTSDYYLAAAMDLIRENGGMAMVHAENGLTTDYLEDKFNRSGVPAIEAFTRMRPAVLEAEAINRALAIAEVLECPIYIPHISAIPCLDPIARAKASGQSVYAETCPQYLELTQDDLFRWGPLAKVAPPFRTREDNQAIWKALSDGLIDVVASDHAPKNKTLDEDFFNAAYGSPQAETLLTVTYDGGVNGGLVTLTRLVQVLCETPAHIFGLYPRKGTLEPGSDADIVVFDPAAPHVLSGKTQHTNAGYTLYEGRECLGRPLMTFQRGHVVLDKDRLAARPGDGTYIRLT
jgi:dihydropyrimidinase